MKDDEEDIYDAVRKYRDSRPEKEDAVSEEIKWARKKAEVLSKFRKEFVEGKYLYDATFHSIVHSLIAGANPYDIIQQLIEDRENLYNHYVIKQS